MRNLWPIGYGYQSRANFGRRVRWTLISSYVEVQEAEFRSSILAVMSHMTCPFLVFKLLSPLSLHSKLCKYKLLLELVK